METTTNALREIGADHATPGGPSGNSENLRPGSRLVNAPSADPNPDLLLASALRYAELGYRVFPCKPNAKTPLTAHGVKDATTDEDQIVRWWTATPTANVAIDTTGACVLDLDPGATCLAEGRDLLQQGVPVAKTPRGGLHAWWRQPDGEHWRNTVGKIAPNVDTRCDGGYVLAPPSVVDGKPYIWIAELDVPLAKLPVAPASLRGDATASERRDVATQSGVIPEGQRNATLARMAGKMRRVSMGEAAIRAALLVENRNRCKPPLPAGEVAKIAWSVARYEPDQLEVARVGDCAGQMFNGEQSNEELGACLMSEVEPVEIDWLWRHRFARGMLSMIVGNPGIGKTMLSCEMMAHLTTGRPWPDGSSCSLGDVFIFSIEDDATVLRSRLEACGADLTRVRYWTDFFDLTQEWPKFLRLLDKARDLQCVFFDPIYGYAGNLDLNKAGDSKKFMTPLRDLAAERNLAIIGQNHERKAEADAIKRAMGSIALVGTCRTVFAVSAHPDDEAKRLVTLVKNNVSRKPPALVFSIVGSDEADDDSPPFIQWSDESVGADIERAISQGQRNAGPRMTCKSRAEKVEGWLWDALSDGERHPLAELRDRAKVEAGIGGRAFDVARDSIGAVTERDGFGGKWFVRLVRSPATGA